MKIPDLCAQLYLFGSYRRSTPAEAAHSLLAVTLDYKHLFKHCGVIDGEPLHPSPRCLRLNNSLSESLQCTTKREHPQHLLQLLLRLSFIEQLIYTRR